MKPMQISEPSHVPQMGCAKINQCLNRFEVMADWGMSSTTMAEWAHAALDRWLRSRMDLTSPSVYDSGEKGKGGDHG
jgi:hypothetical protein